MRNDNTVKKALTEALVTYDKFKKYCLEYGIKLSNIKACILGQHYLVNLTKDSIDRIAWLSRGRIDNVLLKFKCDRENALDIEEKFGAYQVKLSQFKLNFLKSKIKDTYIEDIKKWAKDNNVNFFVSSQKHSQNDFVKKVDEITKQYPCKVFVSDNNESRGVSIGKHLGKFKVKKWHLNHIGEDDKDINNEFKSLNEVFKYLDSWINSKEIKNIKSNKETSMKQYTFKDGFKCVAATVEEAKVQHKVMADKKDYNICVYVENGWCDDFPACADDVLSKIDKKVAYFDPEWDKIACKDEKTANLIKQKVFKKLEGDDKAQKFLRIGKYKTGLHLTSKELEKWVNKTYKGILSYTEDDSGICIVLPLPKEAINNNEELYEYNSLISVDVDDELGDSNIYELKGSFKGSFKNCIYDPIHEDFSFKEIKKLIDDNLSKLREVLNNYKNKQLKIINKECTPIISKIDSILK